ncbi:BACON domain-containing protein [Niabella hirudinis]|uniref:BACON domain-containing protein n=1 Tax=Niabella hirudinis TaxID=1285929 RepID=UPI003EBD1117
MKKIYTLFFIVAIAGNFFSCKKDKNINYKPVAAPFSAALETPGVVAAAGATINVIINAGTDGWRVQIPASAPWCTTTRPYGSGDFTLPVKIAANTSGSGRTVDIVLTPTFDQPPVTITINQAQ